MYKVLFNLDFLNTILLSIRCARIKSLKKICIYLFIILEFDNKKIMKFNLCSSWISYAKNNALPQDIEKCQLHAQKYLFYCSLNQTKNGTEIMVS